jgi:hypothetical protein
MSIVNKPTLIEYNAKLSGGRERLLKFLIMDAPKDDNLHLYIKECKKLNVKHIARISEPCYDKTQAEAAGIAVHVSSRCLYGSKCACARLCLLM